MPRHRFADRFARMGDLLITVAPTGAETTKDDCPQLPTTLEELVETAQRCEAAGAAMIHVHIRDGEHRPTLDQARLKDTVAALREETSLVVQLSTGGSVHDPLEDRLKVLDAEPDSCSLTMGTTNFGDDVFLNPWPFVCDLYQLSQEREVVPEFELFDLGQVAALHRLLAKYGLPLRRQGARRPRHGRARAACRAPPTPSSPRSPRCRPRPPAGRPPGSAARTLPVALASLSKGGHLRVGMEDVLTLARGVPVEHNDQLVTRAAELGSRRPAHADEHPTRRGRCSALLRPALSGRSPGRRGRRACGRTAGRGPCPTRCGPP